MNRSYLIILVILVLFGGLYLLLGKNVGQNKTGQFPSITSGITTEKESKIVELKDGDSFDLDAQVIKKNINGKEVKMLAYNGSIPGPTIKAKKDSQITINFKNDTDVDTALHSHGVRVENQFDGVVDVTQKAVKPGETFTYKIKFPDEGVFWYHPHFREDYAQELGLYGNYIVTSSDPGYFSPVNKEVNLFVDDILLDNSGEPVAFSKDYTDHALMGRFGNTMLINGETDYSLKVNKGDVIRFYLTNSANVRPFNIDFSGAKMKLVGSDNGKYEKETYVDSVLISPSERQIVEVFFDKAGVYKLEHKTPQKTYSLGTVTVSDTASDKSYISEFSILRTNLDVIKNIDPLRSLFTKPADKSLFLTLQMGTSGSMGNHMMGNGQMMQNSQMSMGNVQKIEWEDDMGMMNAQATSKAIKWQLVDQDSQKANMDIDWQFKKGDVVKVKIFNDDKSMHPMQHPIHIHGQRFLVLSTNGQKNTNLVWKDTTLIQTGDTVELLVQMDNPGDWVIHCHIPEHMESGMMSKFKVI